MSKKISDDKLDLVLGGSEKPLLKRPTEEQLRQVKEGVLRPCPECGTLTAIYIGTVFKMNKLVKQYQCTTCQRILEEDTGGSPADPPAIQR